MVSVILVTLLCASLVISVYLAVIVSIRCDSKLVSTYIAILATIFLYTLGYLLEITSGSTSGGLTAVRVTYIGSAFLAPCVLKFVADYCSIKINRVILLIMGIVSLALVAMVWTNPGHKLFYTTYEYVTNSQVPYLAITRGPLYYAVPANTLVCVLISVVFIIYRIKTWELRYRSRLLFLLAATLAPLLSYILYLFGIDIYGIDMTPFSIVLSEVFFYISIMRYGFLDFAPIASEIALRSINEAYILLDKDYNYLDANESAMHLFPELKTMKISSPVEHIKNWPPELSSAKNDENISSVKYETPQNCYYEASTSKITFKNNSLLGYIILIQDITESIMYTKAIEEAKIRAEEARVRAEEANKMKRDFLASMSHEIRTPMNAILGITQIQMQKENLPDEYAEAIEKIYNSGSSLLRIINDILDMSKIETGKLELNPAEYDVPGLINDAVQLNMVRLDSESVKFLLDINENLPSRLYGDELRLKQVLNNLLSNAIKYTKKGHVRLSIDHFTQGTEDGDIMLRFVVEDTGQGIKPRDQERLFTEYQRFNYETNRETEGTGLGLNITKKLVEMMDGTIEAESEYGKGSTFTVTVRQKAAASLPAGSVIGAQVAEELRLFTYISDNRMERRNAIREIMPYGKVLVVDDVETNLYVVEGLLSPYRLNIETAGNGFDAIEKVQSGMVYDIIFMDHMMPQMDGIETTLKLRELGYKGVIVALSANALVGSDEMFRKNGFDGFISKPIDIRQMDNVLYRFIRDRHPEEAGKYSGENVTQGFSAAAVKKLINIFRRDAEKAIKTLRETAGGDIQLFTTTAHAIKSALANIGKNELSEMAFLLEGAGRAGDTEYIGANVEIFVEKLEALVSSLNPVETAGDDAQLEEDTGYLSRQMEIIREACARFDDTAVYAALEQLKERQWKTQTAAALEEIEDTLFLHSDFEEVAQRAALLK